MPTTSDEEAADQASEADDPRRRASQPTRRIARARGLRRRVLLAAATTGAVVVPIATLVASDADGHRPATLAVGAFFGVAAVTLATWLLLISGVPGDIDEDLVALPGAGRQHQLAWRWVLRLRWGRGVGGAAGILWWLIATNGSADPLLCGLTGLVLGAFAAQWGAGRTRPDQGRRTASLRTRTVRGYLDRRSLRVWVGATVTALAAAAAALVAPTDRDRGETLLIVIAWAAVVGGVWLLQWRITRRRRPGVDDGLSDADDLARWLSISLGLARPAAALALVASSWLLRGVEVAGAGAVANVLWVLGALWWLGNRRLGLRSFASASGIDAPGLPRAPASA